MRILRTAWRQTGRRPAPRPVYSPLAVTRPGAPRLRPSRDALRDYFEVDARYVVLAALHGLERSGRLDVAVVRRAIEELEIESDKQNPAHA